MILENINTPQDLKKLSIDNLNQLADEMRECIIKKVNTTGGHMGPNLGILETTIAMHYVFNSPIDKIIFDVSHQCYPHKILTGRKDGFTTPENYLKYTGYTAPQESEHDLFTIGHTSTSISLATGIAKARDIKGEKYNVIALIGDGSLTGGEALEGLNNSAVLNSNFIIIVNDNDMSIAENQGGIYKNLRQLRETKGQTQNNFFTTMGFEYYYVENGNNINDLIEAFSAVKDTNKPTIVHINTLKGHGLQAAEENKEIFHWVSPNILETYKQQNTNKPETFDSITTDFILKKAKKDKTLVAITPATPGACGFNKNFREELGTQYVDVGIAEEHAIAFASGLAKNGAKPILAILSSFVQRTYDQISQDLCLNKSPITMLIYWGGLSGADCTHLGSFDMAMLGNIPNLVYLAPTNKEEYLAMLEWSLEQTEHPVAIRVPFIPLVSSGIEDSTNYSELNKYQLNNDGEKIALIGLGNFYHKASRIQKILKTEYNINASLINPKFITGIDEELLTKLKEKHKLIITLEDGCLNGGFGEKISRFYGNSEIKVLNYGGLKEFTDRVNIQELNQRYRLTPELIISDAMKILHSTEK